MSDTSKYLRLFVAEATEHAEQLARQGPELLSGPLGPEVVSELFRLAHSLRGMSAAMGFDEIVGLSGAIENVLGQVRERQAAPTPATGAVLAKASDVLLDMIRARADGSAVPSQPHLIVDLNLATFEAIGSIPVGP